MRDFQPTVAEDRDAAHCRSGGSLPRAEAQRVESCHQRSAAQTPALCHPARRRDSCRPALELAASSTVAFLLWQPTTQTDREALHETHGPTSPDTCCLVTRTGKEERRLAQASQ